MINNNIQSCIKEYLSIPPIINTRLLIDQNPSIKIHPGNLFVKKGLRSDKRRNLLKNYFKEGESSLFKKDGQGGFSVSDKELKTILFVELEVTPVCDFVQGKWRKSRLLPGILIPETHFHNLQDSESFYKQIPLIKIGENTYKPIFDFRLLKSEDIEIDEKRIKTPLCRLRSILLADILSRLSSHINRVGIAYIE